MLCYMEGPSVAAIGICTTLELSWSLGPSLPGQGQGCPVNISSAFLPLHFCLGAPFTMHVSGDKVAVLLQHFRFGRLNILLVSPSSRLGFWRPERAGFPAVQDQEAIYSLAVDGAGAPGSDIQVSQCKGPHTFQPAHFNQQELQIIQ